MSSAAERRDALTALLTAGHITATEPANGKKFLDYLSREQCESVDDFIGHVDSDNFQAEWKDICTFQVAAAPVVNLTGSGLAESTTEGATPLSGGSNLSAPKHLS